MLGVVSAIVVVVAVWQFSTLWGDDDLFPTGSDQDPVTAGFPSGAYSSEAGEVEASSVEASSEEPSPEPSGPASPTAGATKDAETTEVPEAAATSESPSPSESGSPGVGCTATLELENSWPGNVEVTVRVVNTSDEWINRWEVTLAFGDAEVYHTWGMHHDRRDRYDSDRWNSWLRAGESTEAGFQAEVEDDFELPASVPCRASN